MSFVRLVQPVLDRQCGTCHDGTEGPGKSDLVLVDDGRGEFSAAYDNLKPYVRWYEWGGASISQIATRPGECGADASPLMAILEDENHGKVQWVEEDRRRLMLWLDANAPFYGTYESEARLAQRQGKVVPVPLVQ